MTPLSDQWVVYDHPRDFPHNYVARCWKHDPATNQYNPTEELIVSPEIAPLRTMLSHKGLVALPRFTEDHKHILEVWI
jgi:hypothetical protein